MNSEEETMLARAAAAVSTHARGEEKTVERGEEGIRVRIRGERRETRRTASGSRGGGKT